VSTKLAKDKFDRKAKINTRSSFFISKTNHTVIWRIITR
jgi:hypothetical protein